MGKSFQKTKIGKLIFSKVGKGLIKAIPIAGPILGNIMNENGTESGKIDIEDMKPQLAQGAIILLALAYLLGWITFDDAEAAKSLVAP